MGVGRRCNDDVTSYPGRPLAAGGAGRGRAGAPPRRARRGTVATGSAALRADEAAERPQLANGTSVAPRARKQRDYRVKEKVLNRKIVIC